MDVIEFYVEEGYGIRIDLYLASRLEGLSRNYIQKLIKEGLVLVNGKITKAKYIVNEGDTILLQLPTKEEEKPAPENIPLDIIFEDDYIVIVNKPIGMVVHPGAGNESKTLVNALLFHVDSLYTGNDIQRPGIVHRLDKDTSGLMVVAKNELAYNFLVQQLKNRSVKRNYIALVHGILNLDKGIVVAPIGRHPVDRKKMAVVRENGKEAITHYKVIERFEKYTLLKASLVTGRTHQIRVHMAYINHPIVGENVYSKRKNDLGVKTQLLHANKLGLIHPKTGNYMEFEVGLPEEFKRVLELLRKKGGR
ncbi:RluA family pseudouridine synthase [Tepidimicrobium xylanilyticum]|uniref:Pseudouridine synthase n=1 Tax=Tepidimicrobium xylanilyticum TaxID=1123352 RepID=A0A1H2YS51_9FIRM|nr:RluA family pseudouridine synthase [Tepidimicrobium xylanilyticum]GMG97203.1 pseudouridine synthase [Tepidimicrobium xylanilyticum]SDX08043.1 23S rRNA pseudouridine1911/1915/1917 synthase [Tepidimicrobium xylanilyticum]